MAAGANPPWHATCHRGANRAGGRRVQSIRSERGNGRRPMTVSENTSAIAERMTLIDLELDAAVGRTRKELAKVARQAVARAPVGIVASHPPLRSSRTQRALKRRARQSLWPGALSTWRARAPRPTSRPYAVLCLRSVRMQRVQA